VPHLPPRWDVQSVNCGFNGRDHRDQLLADRYEPFACDGMMLWLRKVLPEETVVLLDRGGVSGPVVEAKPPAPLGKVKRK